MSKKYKNENHTDIPLYDFAKLYENVLKYYSLNLFKEITSGFNHGLQTKSESPASFFDVDLVKINKYWRYPCLQLIFGVAQNFVGPLLNCVPHLLIKRVTIWGDQWLDIRVI